ncbi:hypothetical protein DTO013E5_108 [Penicillium roqueforti]|uniref:Genomic scaffold, ProqFM164S02 n=1 Tax=Penicillium roqueforti (strain FM164) TaxID=1365484 RepID=W6Q4L1_PENRF|nr:uncharacterized protein LCP9604111_1029 [Penicillium roqueforti]CDM31255.1 unnamed protein product [Penicillium roqueforti FM164]KAF9253503.1 hypothetical protein LCP9604111_1029 [Penicillium roqueforti]KAI1839017.1 hypothetical protein CBS147337_742 [Penicillium roqueforti]KAI2681889.1 hypothetical protein CBS147355_3099 [Penicillium roqueforti]KAI2691492.1 hypothetical protein LCP963914a_1693 [Penicillium roqueforti]
MPSRRSAETPQPSGFQAESQEPQVTTSFITEEPRGHSISRISLITTASDHSGMAPYPSSFQVEDPNGYSMTRMSLITTASDHSGMAPHLSGFQVEDAYEMRRMSEITTASDHSGMAPYPSGFQVEDPNGRSMARMSFITTASDHSYAAYASSDEGTPTGLVGNIRRLVGNIRRYFQSRRDNNHESSGRLGRARQHLGFAGRHTGRRFRRRLHDLREQRGERQRHERELRRLENLLANRPPRTSTVDWDFQPQTDWRILPSPWQRESDHEQGSTADPFGED